MESVSQSSLKKHRKLRTPEGDFDYDDPSTASLNHSELSNVDKFRSGRVNPEKIAWILAGCVTVYYSKLYQYLLPSQWPKGTYKFALLAAYICFTGFLWLFVYLNYYLRYVRGVKITAKHWKRDAPTAVPAATLSGSLGFAFMFLGFLPFYHLWALLIFSVLFMSFFAFISLF